MKVEEKMKKNKNCEISHIVRPEVTPEVYNQKQNTLFISGCVEHRRFKVTWARLWVYSAECIQAYARLGGSWRMARPSACVGCMHGSAVRDARLGQAHGTAKCSHG